MKKGALALCASLVVSVPTYAALNDLGNGLVNDTTLNITWLKDANLVKTSCDTNSSLWQAFDPASIANNSGRTKSLICNQDGRLNWFEAELWVGVLNAQNYLGYNDWRLPVTAPVNGTAFNYSSSVYSGANDNGYNISAPTTVFAGSTGSELANLYYTSLANHAYYDATGVDQSGTYCGGPNGCLQNTDPFINMQVWWYWSGTGYDGSVSNDEKWVFDTSAGRQEYMSDGTQLFVWPVRSGLSSASAPSAAQPVPALGGFGLAALGLLLAALARRGIRQ